MRIRVLICDDQTFVRAGARAILEPEADMVIVGEAKDAQEALVLARRTLPDIALLGIQPKMPQMSSAIQDLGSFVKVILLTGLDEASLVLGAIRVGARGEVRKDSPPEDVLRVVRTVAAGDAVLTPATTRAVLDWATKGPPAVAEVPPEVRRLSKRESRVLDLLAQGWSNAEIAGILCVSAATVRSHVHHLLTKLGLRDRVQAVVFAYQHGLVRRHECMFRSSGCGCTPIADGGQ
ncbi:response regulator transcription factor [Plantactinospora soyae]|uniref:DNA-binding NarL/FixJ family response regulator n=1 Tax=Plantactinospora soyae TaxID=1544732 RepID=A0A927R950_9ACTN|nr:response regulator transcription factor [Plantactinospora soyae]MBE1491069.1 DNA-binding NarL/FixJ family response regulator [Plantactinospora soyae]